MKHMPSLRPAAKFIACLVIVSPACWSAGQVQRVGETRPNVITIGKDRDTTAPRKAYTSETPKPKAGVQAIMLKDYNSTVGRIIRETENIVIPELEFAQAELVAVFELLHDVGVRSQAAADGKVNPVNVTLKISENDKQLLVTFAAQNVSLFQAVKSVTHLTGLSYRFVGNVIVIEPYDEEKAVSYITPLEARQNDITRARMSAVVFPEISFRSIPLSKVVEQLRETSAANDTSVPAGEGRQINLNLRYDGATENREVTFHAQNISFYDVVKTICSTFDLQFMIRSNIVIVEAKLVAVEKK